MNEPYLPQAGIVAMQRGDFARAEAIFAQIVIADPESHQSWGMLSIIAILSGKPELGLDHARKAVALERRNPRYLNAMGVALGELGLLPEAKAALLKALRESPTYAEAHYNLGKTLFKMEDLKAASVAYGRAYALDKDYPGVRFNWAYTKRQLGDLLGAKDLLLELLSKNPEDGDAAVQLSEIESFGLGKDALQRHLESFVKQNPRLAAVRDQLARFYLTHGHYELGWTEHWLRMAIPDSVHSQRYNTPISYLPEVMDGSTVLIRAEQGLGDVLFFVRFLDRLRKRGARTVVEVQRKLFAIAKRSNIADEVIEQGSEEELAWYGARCQTQIWAGDLALLTRAFEVAPPVPLAQDEQQLQNWRERLAAFGPPPYLGLTWRAGTDTSRSAEFDSIKNPNRALAKSIPLDQLMSVITTWPGTCVSVQREPYPEETATIGKSLTHPLLDLSHLNDDLNAMLAVLGCLDDYVCVSNTNVHLRAGLGLGGHVLIPESEYRWAANGASSPWFPAWQVYRKDESGWAGAISSLTSKLKEQ